MQLLRPLAVASWEVPCKVTSHERMQPVHALWLSRLAEG